MISWRYKIWITLRDTPEWGGFFYACRYSTDRGWRLSLWAGPLCITLPWWRRSRL